MALIRDKVPGVASRYVTRDLAALLESYSPLRQIEDGLSPGLTDGGEPSPGNEERGGRSLIEPNSTSFSEWRRVELWRWSLQLWMHSVISQELWPVWQTPLTKPAQILWSREERFL